ncbi:MAG: hypothetical protein HRF45_00770 [Fimbriimonadia bacterium]|jgi:hypothetical protein
MGAVIRRRLKWTTVVGWVVALAMIAAIVLLIFTIGNSPVSAVNEFLTALRVRDVNRLSAVTWLPEGSPPAEEQWREIFAEVKPLPISHVEEPLMASITGDTALVKMLVRIHDRTPPQEREIQFFVRRVNGKWKVDVTRLVRDPFEKLPL